MCLNYAYTKRTVQKYRKRAREKGYLRVYKVVGKRGNNWNGEFQSGIRKGLQKAISYFSDWSGYTLGFHCFVNKKDAENWRWRNFVLIECLIAPEWITEAGDQEGTVLVASHCYFPTYPETKAKVRDFRKAIKELK